MKSNKLLNAKEDLFEEEDCNEAVNRTTNE